MIYGLILLITRIINEQADLNPSPLPGVHSGPLQRRLGSLQAHCQELQGASHKQRLVLACRVLWYFLMYLAPWCGHCKKSAPEFEKAAEILRGVVRIGAVNMDEERAAGEPYQIQGYPTIKFFGNNKQKPLAFESSERTYEKFVEYSIDQMKQEIQARLDSEPTEL